MRTTDMPFALRAGTMITGYEVVRPIGAGGFGITYEGYNPITERRVAIKEFFPRGIASRDDATRIAYSKQDDEIVSWALKRFADSTNRLAKLKHPNIIEVLNYVADNGTGYMVMEHVEGQTLEDWLRARKTPPQLSELGPIFDPIFDALEYVHSNGLIHRDIAPDNIMIRADGRPVLIDFGALKIIAEHTRAHGPSPKSFGVVKANYSPPEQSDDGGGVDPRMDVYSLAATIYRAVAGKPPVDADKRKTDTALKGEDSYIPLAKAAQMTVPPEFTAAIDAALSLRPKERPATIAELRARLAARSTETEPATAVIPPVTPMDATIAIPPAALAQEPVAVSAPAGAAYTGPEAKPYTPSSATPDPGQSYSPPGNETPTVRRSGMSVANWIAVVLVLLGALAVLLHRPIINLVDRMSGFRFTMGQEEQQQPQQKQLPKQQQQQQPRRDAEDDRRPQRQQQQQQQQQTPSNDATALLNRANDLQRNGDNRQAVQVYSDAIRLDPTLVNAYTGRGLSYYRLGDGDRAFDDYSVAIRLEPNTQRASIPYLNRAIVWRERLNIDRAFDDINNALRLDPKFALAFNTRANLYYDRRDYDKAIADYNQAISLDPTYATAYANRANAWLGKNQPQRALEDFSVALRLDPKNVNALVGRGNAYDDLKDGDRAIKDYTEALRYDRNHVNAYINRGRIYLARKDFISALSDYSDAVRLDPRRALAHQGRGLANEGLGRREEAIKDLREALRIDSSLTRSREALQRLGVRP
ncbi:MAG: tetratricopeptide repeat protein [Xanthobacteraceae bacterium]|nr:tetratricopeptide repeat protein [Xanthobacteraceae bacterium]